MLQIHGHAVRDDDESVRIPAVNGLRVGGPFLHDMPCVLRRCDRLRPHI